MHLIHLSLTNYRNFTRLDIDVPTSPILLVGANAQGKTSLLEAIYFLATLTAFQANSDRQVINFLASQEQVAVARIVADFQRGDRRHRMEVRIIQEAGSYNGNGRLRKEVLLDGANRKLSEAYRQFNAVLFLPQMMRVIEGAPDERRRYLNLALAQVMPDYAAYLSLYARTLSQRNALLKQLAERGGDPAQLTYWDEQLSEYGAHIILARIQAIQALERIGASVHRELTRGSEVLRLAYQPGYDPLPQPQGQFALPIETKLDRSGFGLEKIRQGFLDALESLHREEISRGVTTIGPHRDELRFVANGIDLGTYGSRGQIRTAMLSMKLAEVNWMRERSGYWPVLLLDEVLAELDPERREDLLKRLAGSKQALLTTTDLDLFTPEFIGQSALWHISAGRVKPAH